MFLPVIDHQETWRSIGRAVVNSHRRLDRALIIGNRCFGSLVSSLAAACSMLRLVSVQLHSAVHHSSVLLFLFTA